MKETPKRVSQSNQPEKKEEEADIQREIRYWLAMAELGGAPSLDLYENGLVLFSRAAKDENGDPLTSDIMARARGSEIVRQAFNDGQDGIYKGSLQEVGEETAIGQIITFLSKTIGPKIASNPALIWHAFIKRDVFFAFRAQKEALLEAGLEEENPVWSLLYGFGILNAAQQGMIPPIKEKLEKFKPGVKILLQNPVGYLIPALGRSEYYRGLTLMIKEQLAEWARKSFPGEEKEVLYYWQTFFHLRTTRLGKKRQSVESIQQIKAALLKVLIKRDWEKVAMFFFHLAREYPELFPDWQITALTNGLEAQPVKELPQAIRLRSEEAVQEAKEQTIREKEEINNCGLALAKFLWTKKLRGKCPSRGKDWWVEVELTEPDIKDRRYVIISYQHPREDWHGIRVTGTNFLEKITTGQIVFNLSYYFLKEDLAMIEALFKELNQ